MVEFRVMVLKLLELTQFASPNQSIYFNFVWCWGSDVVLTLLNKQPVRSPLIEKYMIKLIRGLNTNLKYRPEILIKTSGNQVESRVQNVYVRPLGSGAH